MTIKHVSFDVWGTLIVSNPAFAQARTEFLAKLTGLDKAAVAAVYTATKKQVDDDAEYGGLAYTTDQVYEMLLHNLNAPQLQHMRAEIRAHVDNLFRENEPIILTNAHGTIEFLQKRNVVISIGSNSNFISGTVMYPFLQEKFHHAFRFGVFSDVVGCGKPNPEFFGHILHAVWKNHNIPKSEMLHVGDNPVCDGFGANRCDMPFAIIESPVDLYAVVRSRFI